MVFLNFAEAIGDVLFSVYVRGLIFVMNEMRRMLSYVRRAVDDYEMIEEGDRIAVGISGA